MPEGPQGPHGGGAEVLYITSNTISYLSEATVASAERSKGRAKPLRPAQKLYATRLTPKEV